MLRSTVCWCTLTLAALATTALAHAQPLSLPEAPPPPRLAFAAAETRTRSPQICTAPTLQGARECALNKCRNSGGTDCRVTALCQPAQWAGTLGVALQGSRVALTICGVPSRPGVIARLKDICRSYRSRGLESCTLETVWTPSGEEERAGLRWSRQALGLSRAGR